MNDIALNLQAHESPFNKRDSSFEYRIKPFSDDISIEKLWYVYNDLVVKDALGNLRKHKFQFFAKEIEELVEEYKGEKELSGDSIQGLFAFLTKFKFYSEFNVTEEPLIGLYYRRTLLVEWSKGSDKHLAIEFIDKKTARFAMDGPDSKGKICRDDNCGDHTFIIKCLKENGVGNW